MQTSAMNCKRSLKADKFVKSPECCIFLASSAISLNSLPRHVVLYDYFTDLTVGYGIVLDQSSLDGAYSLGIKIANRNEYDTDLVLEILLNMGSGGGGGVTENPDAEVSVVTEHSKRYRTLTIIAFSFCAVFLLALILVSVIRCQCNRQFEDDDWI